MSQFHWGLRDDVKDLLLSFSSPQMLNKTISQAVKCNNRLFQCHQDQCSRQHTSRYGTTMLASSINLHLKPEDRQINAVCVKSLSPEEKKRRIEKRLCWYCGEGHKAGNCPKKQKQYSVKTKSAIIQENEDVQSQ